MRVKTRWPLLLPAPTGFLLGFAGAVSVKHYGALLVAVVPVVLLLVACVIVGFVALAEKLGRTP